MKFLIKLLGWLSIAVAVSAASAQEVPGSCLVSFNVKDTSFSTGNATMSCRLVEARRVDLTQSILALPATGEVDGDEVARKLDALEAVIQKQAQERNWLGVGEAITGNALATIGLSACMESGGLGCMVAGIGKLMSIHAVYDAAKTDADKQKYANQLRGYVASLRKDVAGKKSKAKAERDRLVTEARALCTIVEKNCL